jgi:hypothetical protein
VGIDGIEKHPKSLTNKISVPFCALGTIEQRLIPALIARRFSMVLVAHRATRITITCVAA